MIEIRHNQMLTTKDTRSAYNEIYQQKGILLKDSFYLWILDLLQPKPERLLVDISCGQGRLVHLAQQKGLQAMGIDFSYQGVWVGKQGGKNAGWVVSDGEAISIRSACADYITHIGSLEHYQRPEAGIREIARLLKPSGIAAIYLPNGYSLLGNIKYVARTGFVFDDGQPLQRYNTQGGWKDLIETNGLVVTKVIRHEYTIPRTRKDILFHIRHPKKILRILISWMIPFNLSHAFVYLCQSR